MDVQWTELGETYLSIGTYRYAAFCYEELVLLNPMDAIYHSRLADVRRNATQLLRYVGLVDCKRVL